MNKKKENLKPISKAGSCISSFERWFLILLHSPEVRRNGLRFPFLKYWDFSVWLSIEFMICLLLIWAPEYTTAMTGLLRSPNDWTKWSKFPISDKKNLRPECGGGFLKVTIRRMGPYIWKQTPPPPSLQKQYDCVCVCACARPYLHVYSLESRW